MPCMICNGTGRDTADVSECLACNGTGLEPNHETKSRR